MFSFRISTDSSDRVRMFGIFKVKDFNGNFFKAAKEKEAIFFFKTEWLCCSLLLFSGLLFRSSMNYFHSTVFLLTIEETDAFTFSVKQL